MATEIKEKNVQISTDLSLVLNELVKTHRTPNNMITKISNELRKYSTQVHTSEMTYGDIKEKLEGYINTITIYMEALKLEDDFIKEVSEEEE